MALPSWVVETDTTAAGHRHCQNLAAEATAEVALPSWAAAGGCPLLRTVAEAAAVASERQGVVVASMWHLAEVVEAACCRERASEPSVGRSVLSLSVEEEGEAQQRRVGASRIQRGGQHRRGR